MKSNLQTKLQRYKTQNQGLKGKRKKLALIGKSVLATLPVVGAFAFTPNVSLNAQTIIAGTGDLTFSQTGSSGILNVPGFGNVGLYISTSTSYSFNAFTTFSTGGKANVIAAAGGVKPFGVDVTKSRNAASFNTVNNARLRMKGALSAGDYIFVKNATRIGWLEIKSIGNGKIVIDSYASTDGTSIKTGQTVLPVELTSFAAMVKEQTVILNWETASEENNAGFEIQRSLDGENFETLTFVEGQGTTLEVQEYVYDDKDLRQNQEYYYRLKQIDYDGQFDYSEIITARLESVAATVGNFYPNPTTNGVTKLEYTSNIATELTVTVYNVTGQILVAETRQVISGANNLELDFSNIAKGSYFVKLEAGDDKQYQKLIIE